MPPRPAVKGTQSRQEFIDEKLKETKESEDRLQHVLKNINKRVPGSSNKKLEVDENTANELRLQLCELFADLILTSPAVATQHDLIGRLWRLCFYGRIAPLRARMTKDKRKQVTASGNNTKHAAALLAQQELSLQNFLTESVTFYRYIIDHLQDKLMAAEGARAPKDEEDATLQSSMNDADDCTLITAATNNTRGSSSKASTGTPASEPLLPHDVDAVVECLYHLLVHLGDLYRYASNLGKAEWAYLEAARLAPGHGHAYNQLAVTSQIKEQQGAAPPQSVVSLYWYSRCLGATHHVFETSQNNLLRLLDSNRTWLQAQRQHAMTSVAPGNAQYHKSVQSRLFLAQWIDLYDHFLQGKVEDEAAAMDVPTLSEITSQALALLLQKAAMGDGLLCKLVTIAAFCEARVLTQENATPEQPSQQPPNTSKHGLSLHDATTTRALTVLMMRTSTLRMGYCLVDRVLQTWIKSSQGTLPSLRWLLPLLLITEYLYYHQQTSPARATTFRDHVNTLSLIGEDLAAKVVTDYHDAIRSFWNRIVEALNVLHPVLSSFLINPNSDSDPKDKGFKQLSLKEYDQLRGFGPFQHFLDDLTPRGVISNAEVVAIIREERQQQSTHPVSGSSTNSNKRNAATASVASSSSNAAAASAAAESNDVARIKALRFVGLGQCIASDRTSAIGRSIEWDNTKQRFLFVEDHGFMDKEEEKQEPSAALMMEGEVDNHNDDDTGVIVNNDETQDATSSGMIFDGGGGMAFLSVTGNHHAVDRSAEDDIVSKKKAREESTAVEDVLVYHSNPSGGPALLVPSAFLKLTTKAPSTTTATTLEPLESHFVNDGKDVKPASLLMSTNSIKPLGASYAPTEFVESTVPGIGETTSSKSDSLIAYAPPAVSNPGVMPPPGFGRPETSVTVPLSLASPGRFRPSTTSLVSSAIIQEPEPTVAESYALFSGYSGLETSNPFAANAVTSTSNGTANNHHYRMQPLSLDPFASGLGSSLFGGTEDTFDGTSLLDASLLSSLFLDDTKQQQQQHAQTLPKTKNPFFTT